MFDSPETPTGGKLDKWGFTIKPTITDDELILICLIVYEQSPMAAHGSCSCVSFLGGRRIEMQ